MTDLFCQVLRKRNKKSTKIHHVPPSVLTYKSMDWVTVFAKQGSTTQHVFLFEQVLDHLFSQCVKNWFRFFLVLIWS